MHVFTFANILMGPIITVKKHFKNHLLLPIFLLNEVRT